MMTDMQKPNYLDHAIAHHQAAEELADIIPSQEMKEILQKLNGVLKTCVDCHLAFKLREKMNEATNK